MALFDWLRRKSNDERQKEFVEKIINKYIGSRANLFKDAQELLLTTKFGLTEQEMSALILRGLIIRDFKDKWDKKNAELMKKTCFGKLSEDELRWILVYCDLHYINKNPETEALLLMELGGKQIGMPSPLGSISQEYIYH